MSTPSFVMPIYGERAHLVIVAPDELRICQRCGQVHSFFIARATGGAITYRCVPCDKEGAPA